MNHIGADLAGVLVGVVIAVCVIVGNIVWYEPRRQRQVMGEIEAWRREWVLPQPDDTGGPDDA